MVIALLVKFGALPNSWKKYDMEDVALGLQNFLICIEMLVAAVAYYFVFSHKPFIDPAAAQVSLSPCSLTSAGHTTGGRVCGVDDNFCLVLRYLVLHHAFECWM